MTYTPTREDLTLVAEMMAVELLFGAYSLVLTREPDMPTSREWQPHLPGADSMELMAVIEPDIMFHAWPEVCVLAPSGVDICASHDNTTADKARALAEAVFKCGVQVARARKQNEQEKV